MREGYVGQPRVSQIVGPNDGDKVSWLRLAVARVATNSEWVNVAAYW